VTSVKHSISALLVVSLMAAAEEPKQPAEPPAAAAPVVPPPVAPLQRSRNGCYFIRMLRPVLPDDDAQRSGFIPLQARVLGTVREPSCVSGGILQPLVPVQRLFLRNAD
jgi:hypothetical protein